MKLNTKVSLTHMRINMTSTWSQSDEISQCSRYCIYRWIQLSSTWLNFILTWSKDVYGQFHPSIQFHFHQIKFTHLEFTIVVIKFVLALLPIYNLIGAFKYNQNSFVAKWELESSSFNYAIKFIFFALTYLIL